MLLLAALVGAIVVSRPMRGGGVVHPVIPYLVAAALFGLGIYGVLVRRNAVLLLAAVELLLNAVNLVLVTADNTVKSTLPHAGSVFALFVIVLAAAEIGVGLAIVLQLYRLRGSIAADSVPLGERIPEDDVAPLRDAPGARRVSAAVTYAAILVEAPAAAGLIGLLLPRNSRTAGAALGIAAATVALVAAIGLTLSLPSAHSVVEWSARWVEFGPLTVTYGVLLTTPMAYVAIAVASVALAVQIYSVSYLSEDRRYAPYAAQISLFTAAMLLVAGLR